ncbi:MAG TPA: flagellar motor protein MotB [Dongiaceae bacterium]|nr:flagellar motor protein MotB [Dongiaceae bacterium]
MADERPIIIKRIKKSGGAHHGGAWKVAYADFVTAMMAFFLLLWLLNAVTVEQRKGIADYFRPTLAIQPLSGQSVMLDGQPAVLDSMNGSTGAEADADSQSQGPAAKDTKSPNSSPNATGAQSSSQTPDKTKSVDEQTARDVVAKAEEKQFEQVKLQIQEAIKQSPELRDLKDNLMIDQTPEGLRIQLIDRDKVSMFPSGSSSMNDKSRELLQKVAQAIHGLPNKLSISGHTDAAPYAGQAGYSNWELSSDRANASRRVLVEAGIDPARVQAVNGKAETDPLDAKSPLSPVNRRISIVLLHSLPPEGSTQGGSTQGAASAPSQEQIDAARKAAAVGDPTTQAAVPKIVPPATLQGN